MDRSRGFMGSDKESVSSHLGVFSSDGLRTLLLAKKEMSQASTEKNVQKENEHEESEQRLSPRRKRTKSGMETMLF